MGCKSCCDADILTMCIINQRYQAYLYSYVSHVLHWYTWIHSCVYVANLCAADLSVEDFYGVQTTWHLHQGCVKKVALELFCLQSGTHNHQFHVWSLLQDLSSQHIHCLTAPVTKWTVAAACAAEYQQEAYTADSEAGCMHASKCKYAELHNCR